MQEGLERGDEAGGEGAEMAAGREQRAQEDLALCRATNSMPQNLVSPGSTWFSAGPEQADSTDISEVQRD